MEMAQTKGCLKAPPEQGVGGRSCGACVEGASPRGEPFRAFRLRVCRWENT